jgi:tetratricopeptide (TPR) repeat protein
VFWEFAFETALGIPLAQRLGYGAPAVERALCRARDLAEQLGESPQLFGVLRGLVGFYKLRARLDEGFEVARRLMRLAEQTQDTALALEATWERGSVEFLLGRLVDARAHLERAIALYDPDRHAAHAAIFGEHPAVASHLHAAWASWMLGYPDQALRHAETAVALAQEARHPNSLAMAYAFSASVHQLRGEPAAARARAVAATTFATEQRLPLWAAMGTIFSGWAAAEADEAGAIDEIHAGLDGWRATGARLGIPFVFGVLADVHRNRGHAADGLALVAEAFAEMDQTGERYYEAELHRLEGELLRIENSSPEVVEHCFRRALSLADESGARGLALRAALSLSRVLYERGEAAEARTLLARVHRTFGEGFATRDLRDAAAFIREMG